jgi:acetyl esterase/lipase
MIGLFKKLKQGSLLSLLLLLRHVLAVFLLVALSACSASSNPELSGITTDEQVIDDSIGDSTEGADPASGSDTGSEPDSALSYLSQGGRYAYRLKRNANSANWLVFVHGGNWFEGSMNDTVFYSPRGFEISRLLAQHNVASIEYPLWNPELGSGTHLEQITAIRDFLSTIKTSDNTVCLMGHSAGAHLAAAVALRYGEWVDCFIGVSGVYDLSEQGIQYDDSGVQDDERLYVEQSSIEASPAALITPSYDIDTLLIHSINDALVHYSHSLNFARDINESTLASSELLLDDNALAFLSHNLLYFAPASFLYPDRMAVVDFLDRHLSK